MNQLLGDPNWEAIQWDTAIVNRVDRIQVVHKERILSGMNCKVIFRH